MGPCVAATSQFSAFQQIPACRDADMTTLCGEESVELRFRVLTTDAATKVSVTGSAVEIGAWHVASSVKLENTGTMKGGFTQWESQLVRFPMSRFPLQYRCFVNGHRLSPTSRPMLWDVEPRICESPPPKGVVECKFLADDESCQSGWVTSAGVGALQLRVSLKKGVSSFIKLTKPCDSEEMEVILHEAVPHDPAIPEGKRFANLGLDDFTTFMFTGQSFEALAFRVDVVGKSSGQLFARGFVPHQTFEALEGHMLCALMTPELTPAGWFEASFLVVVACEHPKNNLQHLHRKRWTSSKAGLFYDIGHRGSGASKKDRSVVRENTVLSFQKAASNKAEFVEFDVHITQDGEVVVHHDFSVKLNLGQEVISIGIAGLTSKQLQSREVMLRMIPSQEHQDIIKAHEQNLKKTLKRTTSDTHLKHGSWDSQRFKESMSASLPGAPIAPLGNMDGPVQSPALDVKLEPVLEKKNKSKDGYLSGDGSVGSSSGDGSHGEEVNHNDDNSQSSVFRIPDKMATLRQAFRSTPESLGFNIEVKYPTDSEKAAMATRFYSRNYCIDAILKEVFEEAGEERQIIFSSFDPDCASLLSLKQPKYPVYFLTRSGTELYDDPRMNSLDAALAFAKSSKLQGVVAESSSLLQDPKKIVQDFHDNGLFLLTWGHLNNSYNHYIAQKNAGVDGIILDDVTKMSNMTRKEQSVFNKTMKSPVSVKDLQAIEILQDGVGPLQKLGTAPNMESGQFEESGNGSD